MAPPSAPANDRTENQVLQRLLWLVEELLRLADDGNAVSQAATRIALYGLVRDTAYRIQKIAQQEWQRADSNAAAPNGADPAGGPDASSPPRS